MRCGAQFLSGGLKIPPLSSSAVSESRFDAVERSIEEPGLLNDVAGVVSLFVLIVVVGVLVAS